MIPDRPDYSALIVGSDAKTFMSVREHLMRVGFRVRSVENGWEALRSVRDIPPDVVIAEFAISDMDGCSLREKFLLDPGVRDIPFIFLTEDGGAEKQIRALRAGVDDCIVKPFDPVVVVARIEAVLARRRAHEEMIRVDPLTRLLNRPSVEREIREELARLLRYQRQASMALIDVDDFAVINQEHGFPMGDLMLTCLGRIMTASIRGTDIAGRLRGEEFVLYLPETPREGIHTLLSRILERFITAADAIANIPVSFSAAIVEAPTDGNNWRDLYKHARQALRRVKEHKKGEIVDWTADDE